MIKFEKSIEYILYFVYELPERIQMFDVIENWRKDW